MSEMQTLHSNISLSVVAWAEAGEEKCSAAAAEAAAVTPPGLLELELLLLLELELLLDAAAATSIREVSDRNREPMCGTAREVTISELLSANFRSPIFPTDVPTLPDKTKSGQSRTSPGPISRWFLRLPS